MTGNKTAVIVVVIVAVVVVALVAGAVLMGVFSGGNEVLRLATTTSTEDSGLLDYILPEFEDEYDCQVDVIAVGSGAAMGLGKNGDVDVLLVHSPAAEIAFVNDGYGESRTLVMYNQFVVVGPEDDPAGTGLATNASQAFLRIYENGTSGDAKFVSRADKSGTHAKELTIWAALGYNETEVENFSASWYLKSGQAMGAVLDMCEELDAYTLSDDATYYARVEEDLIPHLNLTHGGGPELFNQYSVIPVNATMWPHINHTLALQFKEWITSQEGQDLIASFVKYDHQLFFPNAPGYVPPAESMAISAIARTAPES